MRFHTSGRHIQVPVQQAFVEVLSPDAPQTRSSRRFHLIDVDHIMLGPTYESESALRAAEITRGEARAPGFRAQLYVREHFVPVWLSEIYVCKLTKI